MKLLASVFLVVAPALFLPSASGGDEPKNCKLTVKTSTRDGEKVKVKVKVFDVYAVDAKDCEAQARAAEADNDDPQNKTITALHGFRRTKER